MSAPRTALTLLSVAAIAACGSPAVTTATVDMALPADPVTRLIGEIHLHQFPVGAHGWAAFLAASIPASAVDDDQLVGLTTRPTATEGTCTLFVPPTCAPDCGAQAYCAAPNLCKSLPVVQYVDGGPITVTGSQLVPTIRMWFVNPDTGYNSDPAPGRQSLFAGGELLHVSGGTGGTAIEGTVLAPLPVEVSVPDPKQQLHFPTDSALQVRWKPAAAESMILLLAASSPDGHYATIRCVTADDGTLEVPASLMKGLPPPPRSLRFELERDEQRFIKTVSPGVGVLTHAAFSAWQNGME